MNNIEQEVREFYETFGWQKCGDASGEDALHRQSSARPKVYHTRACQRTLEFFSGSAGRLLIAGGGDLPESHTILCKQFSSVCCLDISQKALDISRQKLGDNTEYILGSISEIPKSQNYFDAIYCAHVIYHVDQESQDKTVRELVRVLRPAGRSVIIYRNPHSLASVLLKKKSNLPLIWRLRGHKSPQIDGVPPLYFYAHPLEWWNQFRDACEVSFIPWDVMSPYEENMLYVKGIRARFVYWFCSWYEKHNPSSAVKYWSYPAIILDKR